MGQDPIQEKFEELLKKLQEEKPDERSEEARRFAVTITEVEKVYAYYNDFILNGRGI